MPAAKKKGAAKQAPAEAEQASGTLECPQCSAGAKAAEHTEDVPNFGKVIISSLQCEKCGLKLSDVMCTNAKEPCSYAAEVKTPKDLETKVIKSSSGTVKIPQLGITIEPGPSAEGYITNIEGILERAEEVAKTVVNSKEAEEADEKRLAHKELRRIQGAKKVVEPYTVVVEDPFGNSALVGAGVKKSTLSDEELSRLKKNIEVLEL